MCNGLDVKKNRTCNMPKSVFPYVLDKGQYFDPETSFTQSCFQNKKGLMVDEELNSLFLLMTKKFRDDLMLIQGKF